MTHLYADTAVYEPSCMDGLLISSFMCNGKGYSAVSREVECAQSAALLYADERDTALLGLILSRITAHFGDNVFTLSRNVYLAQSLLDNAFHVNFTL